MVNLEFQANEKLIKMVQNDLEFDTKIKSVACPEAELFLHEEGYHLLRVGDH